MELLANQAYYFAATIVIGLIMGFCYDYYSFVRDVLKLRRVGTLLGDLIFWLLITLIVFLLLLKTNMADLRFYVFIGISLGALIYYLILSRAVRITMRFKFFLLQRAWELMVRVVLFLWFLVNYPIRLLFLILSYPINFFQSIVAKLWFKIKLTAYNLVGRPVEQKINAVKMRLAPLAFWRKKEE